MPKGKRPTDLDGQRFGHLVAKKPEYHAKEEGYGDWYWHCQCDCGRDVLVSAHALRRKKGRTSCGCQRAKKAKKKVDLAGQRFGRLVVQCIEEERKWPSGASYTLWRCQCDCGRVALVSCQCLKANRRDPHMGTASCGCLRREVLRSRLRTLKHAITQHKLSSEDVIQSLRSSKTISEAVEKSKVSKKAFYAAVKSFNIDTLEHLDRGEVECQK